MLRGYKVIAMVDKQEIYDKVADRYDTYELAEALGLQHEIIDDELYDLHIEDFIRVFKNKVLNKSKELDIW